MWEHVQSLRLYQCSYFFCSGPFPSSSSIPLRRASSVWVVWGFVCWDSLTDSPDIKPRTRQTLAVGLDVLHAARLPRERKKELFMFNKGFNSNRPSDKWQPLIEFTPPLQRSPAGGFTSPWLHMHGTRLPCDGGANSSCGQLWVTGKLSTTGLHTEVCECRNPQQKPLSAAWRARCMFNTYTQMNSALGASEKPSDWPETGRKSCILTGRNLELDEAHDILLGKGGGGRKGEKERWLHHHHV